MHPEPHTDLDNLNTVQHNLRNSAKGSNDAYDVTVSLTEPALSSPRIVPIGRRNWIDIEPGKCSFSDYEVTKKVTYLLRHSQHVHREEDGAVHFWRTKENLQS